MGMKQYWMPIRVVLAMFWSSQVIVVLVARACSLQKQLRAPVQGWCRWQHALRM